MLASVPPAVYQIGRPLSSNVNQTTPTCPLALKMSKPLPERVGSHQCPWANGERSDTETTASAGAANTSATTVTAIRKKRMAEGAVRVF